MNRTSVSVPNTIYLHVLLTGQVSLSYVCVRTLYPEMSFSWDVYGTKFFVCFCLLCNPNRTNVDLGVVHAVDIFVGIRFCDSNWTLKIMIVEIQ